MVRVGFVGLGHNGLAHIEAHRRVGRSIVAAVCDRNPRLLEEASRRFEGAARYESAEELCADQGVDAVSVNTGDPHHVEPFVAAVRAGKHVLVEKPLANSVEQVETMVRVAREAGPGLKIAAGYILRFNPVFEAIQELCRSGRLGRIYYLEADYVHNLLYQAGRTDPSTGRNWYLEEERPMVGGGSHPLDLLRWCSGLEVQSVCGYSSHVAFPAMKEDDCQVALFRLTESAVAKVAAVYAPRMAMAGYYNLRIYGTLGTVERDQVAVARDEEDVHPEFRPVEADRISGHPYDREIEDWLRAIEEDRSPRCGLLDGANSTVATLTAVEAMAAGTHLEVPCYPRD